MKIVTIKTDENLDRVRACPMSEVIVISSCRVFPLSGRSAPHTRRADCAMLSTIRRVDLRGATDDVLNNSANRAIPEAYCRSARNGGSNGGLNQRDPDPWFTAISKVQSEVSVGRDYCRPAARGFVGGRPRLALSGESRRAPSAFRRASADERRHLRWPLPRPSRSRPPACPVPRPRRWMTCPSPIAPCRRVRARC